MGSRLIRSGAPQNVRRSLAGIVSLLLIATISIIPLSYTIVYYRQSDAVVIDVAGRQRMLLERYMKELLLAAEGSASREGQDTRRLLEERVATLMNGGTVTVQPGAVGVTLPPAPTPEIREKLERQQRLLASFTGTAGRFLAAPSGTAEQARLRAGLLAENAELLSVSNEIVMLLTRHAEERVQRLIRWEVLMVLLVVAVSAVRTWRLLQAEGALAQSRMIAMEALRQRDAVKSSLLSSVSHELRTPLTAVKTMVSGLRDETGAPVSVRRELLEAIDEELDYLNRLVGNLLDMSRIEGGALVPRREWHVLDELIEAATRRMGSRLSRRPFEVRVEPDLPLLYVDAVLLQQVLVNLLDNAVKFSPPGSPITLEASCVEDGVEVSVTNTGPGIPPEELERVFERFHRARVRHTSPTSGTGLGLAICKGMIEAHGGRITARSVPDQWTMVSFRLPASAAAGAVDPERAPAAMVEGEP